MAMADTKDAAKPAAKDDTKAEAKVDTKDDTKDGSDATEAERSGGQEYQDIPQSDFPLTVTVFNEDMDREVHRTQVDHARAFTQWDDLISKDLPSGDLDHRFPGKKKVTVTDVNGRVVHTA